MSEPSLGVGRGGVGGKTAEESTTMAWTLESEGARLEYGLSNGSSSRQTNGGQDNKRRQTAVIRSADRAKRRSENAISTRATMRQEYKGCRYVIRTFGTASEARTRAESEVPNSGHRPRPLQDLSPTRRRPDAFAGRLDLPQCRLPRRPKSEL